MCEIKIVNNGAIFLLSYSNAIKIELKMNKIHYEMNQKYHWYPYFSMEMKLTFNLPNHWERSVIH